MRKDLIIGIMVAALVHAGFIFGLNRPSAAVKHSAAQTDDTIKLEMPELVQEAPEKIKAEEMEQQDEDVVPLSFAPPSLVDIPSIAPDTAFLMDVTPPPPPGVQPAKGIMTIPPTQPPGFGRGLGQIFRLDQLDQSPVPRFQQKPIYPYEMQREGMNGEVNVGFIVDLNGDVRDAYVMNSTRREFEAAAVQAVSKWKFRPGRKGGRPVNTRMSVPVVFNIQD